MRETVGERLTPLVERGADQGKHKSLLGFHRRLFVCLQVEHRALDCGAGEEAGLRYLEDHFRGRIILDRKRQGTILPAACSGTDTVSDLFLNHDGDALKTSLFLQQADQDRCRHIIWKIRDHLERTAPVVAVSQFLQIRAQNVLPDDIDIVTVLQGKFKHRAQALIYFHTDDPARGFGEILGHGSDTRADLQDTVLRPHSGCLNNTAHNISVRQKILSEFFSGPNAESGQYSTCHSRCRQLFQINSFL